MAYKSDIVDAVNQCQQESSFAELVVMPVVDTVHHDLEFDPIMVNAYDVHCDRSAAKLIHKPDDTVARIGSTICLTATFSGWPEPSVTWYRAVSIILCV